MPHAARVGFLERPAHELPDDRPQSLEALLVLDAHPFPQSGLVGPPLHAQKLTQRLVGTQTPHFGQSDAPAAKAEKDLGDDGLGGKAAQLVLPQVHASACPDLLPEPEILGERIDDQMAAVGRRAVRILDS